MKYWLVVGFFCEVYQKEPRARLFLNDKLIDEFNIVHEPENKNLIDPSNKEKKSILTPITEYLTQNYIKKTMPSLRFYQVEIDNKLKKTSVKIEIDNDDSNYMNGFMNSSTLIKCKVLALVPVDKEKYYWLYNLMKKRRFRKYAWSRRKFNNYLFGLEKNMHLKEHKDKNIWEHFIGGSVQIHCYLKKKYGLLVPHTPKIKQPYLEVWSYWRPITVWYKLLEAYNLK